MATTHIPLRDARDRLVDMLGIGQSYPLLDLVVRTEQLTVAFDTPAKIPIENSQYGVMYTLHNDQQEEPDQPIQAEGNGETLFLETNPIQEDARFLIYAKKIRGVYGQKIDSGPGGYLHQVADVEVGLDLSLRAWIEDAPSLDPAVIDPTGNQARIIFYQEQVDVVIENSQEGVDYHLVYLTATEEEVVLSDEVRGDLSNITLRSAPLVEDIEIRVRATKTFDTSEDREPESKLLKVGLPIRVRANPDLAISLDPAAIVDYEQSPSIRINVTQDNVRYQLFGRPIRDHQFYRHLCPEDASVAVTADGEPDPVRVCRPPHEPLWATPEGFVPWGEPLQGTGGELAFELESMQADHLFIVSGQKLHSVNGETGLQIPSLVQLSSAAVVLVRPIPDQPLKLQVTMIGDQTDGHMLVTGGQPGVFYYFYLEPEGQALGLPAYFHQRDDVDPELNKGLGQLGIEVDYVIGRDPVDDLSPDLPTTRPAAPLLETGPLPGGTTLHVRAKKAMTRVYAPLAASARIPALPEIRLQDPIVDYNTATKIQVIASLLGDRYQPWLDDSPLKQARHGNENDLSFNTNPMTEDTIYEVRVTRPADKDIPVERLVLLQAIVRPDTTLAVTAAESMVAHNSRTAIQVESSQPGVNYQLLAGGETIGEPLAGEGQAIFLFTEPLTADTTFTVRAFKAATPEVAVDLDQTVTVQIQPERDMPAGGEGDGD